MRPGFCLAVLSSSVTLVEETCLLPCHPTLTETKRRTPFTSEGSFFLWVLEDRLRIWTPDPPDRTLGEDGRELDHHGGDPPTLLKSRGGSHTTTRRGLAALEASIPRRVWF